MLLSNDPARVAPFDVWFLWYSPMKLKLTNKIQELITAALDNPEFSVIHKEEASEIISLKLDSERDCPVSTDLIEYSAKLQGNLD
jgi:hypothetical protein